MSTRAGFLGFIRSARIILPNQDAVVIDSTALPDNSADIDTSLAYSLSIVATDIQTFNAIDYDRAVYNLAMHDLIINSAAAAFATVRAAEGVTFQKTGFVQSTSDVSTSTSLAMPEYLTKQSPFAMELSKTQYGLQYIAIISRYGALATFYAA